MRFSSRALGLLVSIVLAAAAGAQPGAYELLAEVDRTYRGLEAYHDRGTIEQIFPGRPTSHFRFETASGAAGFSWRLEGVDGEQVFWRDGAQGWSYRSAIEQYRPIESLLGEIAAVFGQPALDALVVPALLLGTAALDEAEGAAVDGPEACATSTCWVVTLSRMAGTVETVLWVDQQSHLIHRVEARFWPPETIAGADRRPHTLIVEHQRLESPAGETVFVPPARASLVDDRETGGGPNEDRSATSAPADDELPDHGFFETITVDNATVVLRAIDRSGHAIGDLSAGDLVAKAGDEEIPIVALDWVSPFAPGDDHSGERALPPGRVPRGDLRPSLDGRLFVLFVQADVNAVRIRGHLRLRHYVEKEFLPTLHPSDWVAVLTFDSHLKLWHDFTRDRRAIADTLHQAIRFGGRPLARRNRRGPSILDAFDVAAGRRIAGPEEALKLVGEALQAFPGRKDVVYLGWGLGTFDFSGVRMKAAYWPALRALQAAGATVYSLDATDADQHSLAVGMQRVAGDTGGTYHRTNSAKDATLATRRLGAMLRGYFVLTLDVSGAPAGLLKLRLREKKGELLYGKVRVGEG